MTTHTYEEKIQVPPNGERKIYVERTYGYRPSGHASALGNILYVLLDIVEVLLAFRLILTMLAANPANVFVRWIHQITAPLVSPFTGIFSPTVTQGTLIEWSTVLAMVVYALAVYLFVRLLEAGTKTPAPRA